MKKVLFIVLALPIIAFAITPIERANLYKRKRIISQEVVSNQVITTYLQQGKTWSITNQITYINEPIPAPIKYSKLKLIVAAKAAGKWNEVKAAITAMNLEDEWNACQFITSDYPAYIAATNAVIKQGVASEAEVKAFMKQAEDN
jgi:hypothetical protein